MKRTWIVLLGLMLLAAPTAVKAQFNYTTNDDNTLTITWYSGNGGNVGIPDTIDDLTVSEIGSNAFGANTSLTGVSMSTNVANICDGAFAGCSSLTNVTMLDGLTNIGNGAFAACSSLANVTLPDIVANIGDVAFILCSSLPSVTIPSSVTSLGVAAFQSCTNLTNATISNGVTSLGSDAFAYCSMLASASIPGSLTNIGTDGFEGCSNLTKVTISNGLTTIGPSMFQSCQSLRNIIIPTTVTNIGDVAFSGASLTTVTIPTNVISIGEAAFASTSLGCVSIPASVTNIGLAAFQDCLRLTNIVVSGQNLFYSSLNGVLFDITQSTLLEAPDGLGGNYTIPSGVTSIGDTAFANCSLAGVIIPASVTNIAPNAFSDSPKLTTLLFVGNAPATDPTAFESDTAAVIYYLPGATGWSSPFAGLPAVLADITSWASPASIIYGTPLGSPQLNAASDLPGSFAYTPANGTVLPAGTNTLSVVFTPSNTVYYTSVTNTVSLVVSPAPLTITAHGANKTYGHALAFAGTEFAANGLVNGDAVASVTLASAGAAATAAVAGSPYSIVPSAALPASLTNNYTITYQSGQLTVNPAQVAVASGITANNKFYDGTTTATLSSNNVVLTGVVNGDSLSLTTNGYTANFASVKVGLDIAVTVSGLSLSGAAAGNYSLTQPAGLAANISSPSLQIFASKPNIVLSWPASATDYVLKQTASLALPVTWSPVTNSITIVGTNNTVSINAASGVRFFELIAAP